MGKEVMGKKENEMAQEKERPAGSQSLFRGLMLIEILSNYPNGCPLAHLSELAGLNKSTVHRLLQGLQSCGYVTTAPAAGSYRLTTKFIAVGQKARKACNASLLGASFSGAFCQLQGASPCLRRRATKCPSPFMRCG